MRGLRGMAGTGCAGPKDGTGGLKAASEQAMQRKARSRASGSVPGVDELMKGIVTCTKIDGDADLCELRFWGPLLSRAYQRRCTGSWSVNRGGPEGCDQAATATERRPGVRGDLEGRVAGGLKISRGVLYEYNIMPLLHPV